MSSSEHKHKVSFSNIPPEKIIAYIKSNFDYKTRKNGAEYVICNPLNGDVGYHFNINPVKGTCHDWRGNEWAGPINPNSNRRNCTFINFIRRYKQCSYTAALTEILGTNTDIKDYIKPNNRIVEDISQNKYKIELPADVLPLSTGKDTQAKILVKWLKSRGYTSERIDKFELQYLGMDVYWPYFEFGVLVYWQSRSRLNKKFNFPSLEVKDDNGKIIGFTDGSKGEFIYGFDEVDSASYVIITEAIFDQNTLGDQALASGGAVLTSKQVNKIKILGPKKGIILSPDNDKAGIKSIISNYELLSPLGYDMFYSIPPEIEYVKNKKKCSTKDWNEVGEHIVGFENVRKIHDENIRRLDEKALVELELKNE